MAELLHDATRRHSDTQPHRHSLTRSVIQSTIHRAEVAYSSFCCLRAALVGPKVPSPLPAPRQMLTHSTCLRRVYFVYFRLASKSRNLSAIPWQHAGQVNAYTATHGKIGWNYWRKCGNYVSANFVYPWQHLGDQFMLFGIIKSASIFANCIVSLQPSVCLSVPH